MKIQVLYFAAVREQAGIAAEEVELEAAGVTTVATLLTFLRERGGAPANALAAANVLRFAVNQYFVKAEQPLRDGDEVAVFPPMTGG